MAKRKNITTTQLALMTAAAVISLRDNDDEAHRTAEELGINLSSRFETSSVDEI